LLRNGIEWSIKESGMTEKNAWQKQAERGRTLQYGRSERMTMLNEEGSTIEDEKGGVKAKHNAILRTQRNYRAVAF
jgi:hypothetical protein